MPRKTSRYINRMVNLEPRDYRIVRRAADDRGLGGKGFSAALRIIIREWEAIKFASAQNLASLPSQEAGTEARK